MNLKTLGLAALDIATLGNTYHIRQERELKKSLRDASLTGQEFNSSGGGVVRVVPVDGNEQSKLMRKINVNLLRSYAEFSVWVRTGIDQYRETVSKAEPIVGPVDPERPMDRQVQKDLETLFKEPNSLDQPNSELKELFVEDYLVIGHAAWESLHRMNNTPYELQPINAQYFAFCKDWKGESYQPRYAELDDTGHVRRWLKNQDAIALVNRPRSYDVLGLSHVEILDRAVRALLDGDEFLTQQILNGAPNGALFLGNGITRQQAEEVASQIRSVKRAFAVIAGTNDAKFVNFTATPDQMKILDTQTWFVRQVAATFQLPTVKFGLEVDQSRANTESMLINANEGPGALLWKVCQMENAQIVKAHGPLEEHNCQVTYAVLNQRDEQLQADISNKRLAGKAYSSINEEREANGLERLDNPMADVVLVDTPQGPVPLDVLAAAFGGNSNQLPQGKRLMLPARTGKHARN